MRMQTEQRTAKYGADWQEPSPSSQELGLSINFVSRKVREQIPAQWSNIWSKTTHSRQYKQFQSQPALKASPLYLPQQLWSTIMHIATKISPWLF
jgi:hypothetical protein